MRTYVICSALISNRGKFLIAKRSPGKRFAPGEWELVSGFIDKERKTAEEIMMEELREELNISGKITKTGAPFVQEDKDGRWIVIPFAIETDAAGVRINDGDHTEIRWVTKKEFAKYANLEWFLRGFRESGLL